MHRFRVRAQLTLLTPTLLAYACGSSSPLFCESSEDCTDPARPFCDIAGQFPASDGVSRTCIPNPVDAGPGGSETPDSGPGEITITMTRTGDGAGTVVSDPPGLDCGTTCTATFAAGADVHLTAIASGTSSFLEWTGACAGRGRSCEFVASEDATVGARFEPRAEVQWAEVFAQAGEQTAVAVDVMPGGDLIVAGEFRGNVSFGAGHGLSSAGLTDIYVLRMSHDNGQVIWSRRIGDELLQRVGKLAVDELGDVTLLYGEATEDSTFYIPLTKYVVRLGGTTGQELWRRTYPYAGSQTAQVGVGDMDVFPDGRVVVVGTLFSAFDFGAGSVSPKDGTDGYIQWIEKDGAHQGLQMIDGDGNFPENAFEVAVGPEGTTVVLGAMSTADLGGLKLPPDTFYAAAGFSGDRAAQWAWPFPISSSGWSHDLALDANDDLYFTGDIKDPACDKCGIAYLTRFIASTGARIWTRRNQDGYGYPGNYGTSFLVSDVEIDHQGRLVLAGRAGGDGANIGGEPPDLGVDEEAGWILSIDSEDSSHRWLQTYGGDSDASQSVDIVSDIALGPLGEVYAVGTFHGTMQIGGASYAGVDGAEAFIVKLSP